MDKVGFILLRHVNSAKTDLFWRDAYQCIRNIYPENKIVIIDSQSNPEFLSVIPLTNTEIIESEFPQRGEFLPYYYFLKHRWFETAVVFHDSVYIHHHVDFSTDSYKLLWGFHGNFLREHQQEALQIIKGLDNHDKLLEFYNTFENWCGCLGSMTSITYDFLKTIDEKYNLDNLLKVISSKRHREALERVFPCMLQLEKPAEFAIAEDLFKYLPYGIPFEVRNDYSHLPVIKTWAYRE